MGQLATSILNDFKTQNSIEFHPMVHLDKLSSKLRRLSTPLLKVHQVPRDVREVAILGGYRPPSCSVVECVVSIFFPTNETLNFWTHFLPTWYFAWKLLQLSTTLIDEPYSWPFLSFMLISCLYPLASCMAHAFSGMSLNARHVCFLVDYAFLSLYSYGVSVIYQSYSLPESIFNWIHANTYLYTSLLVSAISTIIACWSRFYVNRWFEVVIRVAAYALACLWGLLPILIRILECFQQGDECSMPSFPHHLRHFVFSLIGASLYSFHVPERFAPGRFDIIGHSHQWLHLCSITATNEQMSAVLLDMKYHKFNLSLYRWMSPMSVCLSVLALFCWNFVAVVLFTYQIINLNKQQKSKREQ